MPRRKQPHPLHLDCADQLANFLENGILSESSGEDGTTGDEHICGKCRLEFIDLSDFLQHKRLCTRKRLVLIVGDDSSDDFGAEGRSTSSVDFTDDVEKYGRDIPYLYSSAYDKHDSMDSTELPPLLVAKTSQSYNGGDERSSDLGDGYSKSEPPLINTNDNFVNNANSNRTVSDYGVATLPPSLPQYILSHPVPDTNVRLQTLENTRVAVAQQAAGVNNVSHLAALHSALYTLQQQQIIQLQVIQQLQTQLVGSPTSVNSVLTPVAPTLASLSGTAALTPPQSSDGSGGGGGGTSTSYTLPTTTPSSRSVETVTQTQNLTTIASCTTSTVSRTTPAVTESSPVMHTLPPPPPPNEPNTLELLQRHTEQALQNTMAGSSFLLNGLSGLSNGSDILRFCKNKSDMKREGDDAYFRHRCRFCGKVFGSDSALQIHIRSHTGERPFKCNVCGNRFSTKGNLKVHFQRHKAKYPHIKMNPHPVPLHLDSLHPPLEPPEASEPAPLIGTLPSTQTISQPLAPPNLVAAQPIPLVTHYQEKERESISEPPSQTPGGQTDDVVPRLQSRSVSPNEASNLTDESEGSVGEDYGSEDNTLKESEKNRYEEEMMDNDDDSFSSSPKPEQKDSEENGDDEAKPVSENNSSMNAVSAIPAFSNSTAPTFPAFFHPSISPSLTIAPIGFPPMATPTLTSTPTSKSSKSTTSTSSKNDENEQLGPSPDPNLYQDLLPKPGSNDNSWESLMEVTKTSETSKLQQLVDNIEHKLSDPNQCAICHRVLSCKSALLMHYRTHTGERPFKCKICSRAFTTKGNLKTHMGVHRTKPPLRVLHQCPVCHKQFTNSLVLQQHIRMHTGEPTDMHPEQIMANEVRPSPLLATSFQRPMIPAIMPHFTTASALPPHSSPVALPPTCPTPKASEAPTMTPPPVLTASVTESVIKTVSKSKESTPEDNDTDSRSPSTCSRPPSAKADGCSTPQATLGTSSVTTTAAITSVRPNSPAMDRPIVTTAPYSPAYTASLVALENHVKAINTTLPQSLPFSPFGMGLTMGGFLRYDDPTFMSRCQPKDMTIARDKSPAPFPSYSPSPNASGAGSDASVDERSTPESTAKGESPISMNGGTHPSSSSSVITSKSETGALDLTPKTSAPVASPLPDMKLFPSPLAGLPFPAAPGRLSTTCRICFKTFACNSALEIHYRSHTKERPFKCNVCDRGFSTKGNMKQHMLTHKIRDLPPQLFTISDAVGTSDSENSSTNTTTPRATSPNNVSNVPASVQNNNTGNREKKEQSLETATSPPIITPAKVTATTITPEALTANSTAPQSATPKVIKNEADAATKRPLSDPNVGTSLPKRPPGLPKHFCHICQKPFSSASALMIHNRTHTGDKPFKCAICGRAFTTKGNLKVHMSTHMYNNGTSRRGRRMSLELPPLPITPHGKPDFSHHVRQDLYFPYLPPGYINGMAGPPKMNEISVIQTATGFTNGNINVPASMTFTPAAPMMTPAVTLSQPQQYVKNTVQTNNDSDGADEMESRSPDEAENLKVQQQPSSNGQLNMTSVARHSISPSSGRERSPNWGWKISCNVCSKICSSSSDLEVHLKSHCNSSVQDNVRSSKQTAENIAS